MALSKAAAHGNARVGSGFGMNAKRKGWLESAKIFLYVGFPIGFTILQAKPEVMGWVVQNREYVRFPAESKDSDCDTDKIRREAKVRWAPADAMVIWTCLPSHGQRFLRCVTTTTARR